MLNKIMFAAITAGVIGLGSAGSTATISFIGDRVNGKNTTSNYSFGTAECSIGCLGVLSNGALSPSEAFATNFGNASPSEETAGLSDLLGLTGDDRFTMTDAVKLDPAFSPFDFTGLYVALKIGNMTGFLFNTAGVAQTVIYTGNSAGGISHTTNIGEVPAVPLPAAAWMLLAALGSLFAASRRRSIV